MKEGADMARRYLTMLLFVLMAGSLFIPVSSRAAPPDVPLILIHGHGASPEITWQTLIGRLEAVGYRLGENLFALDLTVTGGESQHLGLLADARVVAEEMERLRAQIGVSQFDLVGHSRGGLIVRLLAVGETAPLVRRAVTLNTPHTGVLDRTELKELLAFAGVDLDQYEGVDVPDLEMGSAALTTLYAREARFGDQRPASLSIGSQWRQGLPAILSGHDGVVSLSSQLAWESARTYTVRLGPTASELERITHSGLAAVLLVWHSPHLQSHESAEVANVITSLLLAPRVDQPLRACGRLCNDWSSLRGHWAEKEIRLWLTRGLLPYTVSMNGDRLFEPDRPMTRAEFIYGLVRAVGLPERLGPTDFADMEGHWALGYVEAAREAGLLEGMGTGRFGPNDSLTRAEAVVLIVRTKGLKPVGGRESIAQEHWAVREISAAVSAGLLTGDTLGLRPDAPLTMAEGSVMLIRGFAP
jgi:pimeloyl-ACP methyl ester carboxylesterase